MLEAREFLGYLLRMRVLLIHALAVMVAGSMIMSSIDRCTDDCRGGLVIADSCGDGDGSEVTRESEESSEHDEDSDGDAPCPPLCPNCARPALVALLSIVLPVAYVDAAPIGVFSPLLVATSPPPTGLFRPPRA